MNTTTEAPTKARTMPANLLAAFDGHVPDAPDWFQRAIAAPVEHSRIKVDGAEIDLRAWGERGKPGILLIHGSNAHAGWWDHIGPLLASDWRVGALSLSGMGESEWRPRYTAANFEEELFAAAEALGLFDNGKPVFIAHSFGGIPMATAAANRGEKLRAAIYLDSGFRPQWDKNPSPPPAFKAREYPDVPSALARFRLMPPQSCDNLFIADYIARHSLREITTEDGTAYSWSFDPDLWAKMTIGWEGWESIPLAKCPIAFISGQESASITAETVAAQREHAPEGTPFISIAEAQHHVMIDQPLALVSALRALLTVWPSS